MLRRNGRDYVCWRCLCLGRAERAALRRRTPAPPRAVFGTLVATKTTPPSRTLAPAIPRHDRSQVRSVSTEPAASAGSLAPAPTSAAGLTVDWPNQSGTHSASQQSSIRERLRLWEAENPAPALAVPRDEPADGYAANTLTKNRSEFSFRVESFQDEDATRPHFDGVDVVDLGLSGSIQGGDLVEVNSGSLRLRLLAVCLGNFNGHLHFYTNTGKWFTSRTLRSGFVVKNFVQDPAELQAVVDAIPSLSPSSTVLNELQDLNVGPSRDLAASLIRKMYNFQNASRHVHQTYVERLSRANKQLGSEERLLNLREIADALLPTSLKRNKGSFPPEALYAVYSVIEEDDIAFRALDRGARHHESYHFVHHSAEAQGNVLRVEQLVRDYYDFISGQTKASSRGLASVAAGFDEFLEQARNRIDQARKTREWSPYGMVGPPKEPRFEASRPKVPTWSEAGLAITKFMEHWAAPGRFRFGSRCHWIGAAILRALGRYDEALLDSTTGWTFLQEIGWIPPWDISARHALRLPDPRRDRHTGLLPTPAPEPAAAILGRDQLADLRLDFARSTAYCIDSADTLDVDDGLSLEPLSNGQYWIHIHVADPASRITPDSPLAKQTALRAQTNYLAGFYQRMLDGDGVRDAFSLGPNQPTLTFSARVTESGRLLDSKVTPGILRDVVYITPEDVSSVCGAADASTVPPDILEVGTPPAKDYHPTRRMTAPSGLSKTQRGELKTLSRLAEAFQRVRLDNGAMPVYLPRPKAKVSMHQVTPETVGDGSVYHRGDPYIRVAYDEPGNPLVSSLMQLAGEIGARWCYERDIPIPYRIQLVAEQNLKALRAFNRDVFYPQLAAGKNPSAEDWHTLRGLAGGFDISTVPAPNLAMGLDLYTKVTSPLRRYPDLLVHWQIEAALLQEHRSGKSLVVRHSTGAEAESEETAALAKKESAAKEPRDFLPFSRKKLEDEVLPRLRIRERHARLLDNVDGNSQWILQALVRAWRFGEGASQLPETFRFTVSDVAGRRAIKGQLNWFDRPAMVEIGDLNGVVRIGDVKPGDVFKVALANVNVHMNKINVRLLGKG